MNYMYINYVNLYYHFTELFHIFQANLREKRDNTQIRLYRKLITNWGRKKTESGAKGRTVSRLQNKTESGV